MKGQLLYKLKESGLMLTPHSEGLYYFLETLIVCTVITVLGHLFFFLNNKFELEIKDVVNGE
jgi:hypothetical protein